ncbi:response regulator transcription factor [Rothia sp. P100]|uniref:response regulator n=1 Tax=unclassified Rothia (in: high G+C Gram-positive bacteria) TaxID=2689056 RepID=UPI0009C66A52|nr:response regulator transcription factor [Rothia sp. P100]MCM3510784.1 response regulator transcription factor [Rothia sp. P100]SLE69259.1 response regulator containing a CheY-like receiver domain and an HTH DNA-binding domain [Mycobacteroides abscessus subsp. bolletii]
MVKVLLVDDESLIRNILKDYLSSDESLEVVGEASNGKLAISQARALQPDVILMDMQMPLMDGVEATQYIHHSFPDIRILGLSTFATDRYVVELLRAGASGYLVKDSRPEEVTSAIHTVHDGGSVLSPEVTRYVVQGLEQSVPAEISPDEELMSVLTAKEIEVIELLARGLNNKEMAAELFVTESTIKARFVKIMEKMQVRDRVQILVKAIEHNLINLKTW